MEVHGENACLKLNSSRNALMTHIAFRERVHAEHHHACVSGARLTAVRLAAFAGVAGVWCIMLWLEPDANVGVGVLCGCCRAAIWARFTRC